MHGRDMISTTFQRGLAAARRVTRNERQMFVVLNIIVNLLLFGRSYVTMQVLDYRALGLAALVQGVVLLVASLQLGFLNGSYRLIVTAAADEARRINNLVYTSLALIALVSLAAATLSLAVIRSPETILVALLGVVGGVMTLVRNWMTNRLIAEGRLGRLNSINFWTALMSLGPLLFVAVDPLKACLFAIVVQPAAFVIAVAIKEPAQLPTQLIWPRQLVIQVLRIGFVLFLTGIFLQVNLQLERWYITSVLGVAALGHLYLAFLFVTLFQMVPTSLDQLFLPQIVRAFDHKAAPGNSIRQYVFIALGYCTFVIAIMFFLSKLLTEFVLPQYVGDLVYVYLLAPGLMIFTIASPLSLIFNVMVRYRYSMIAYGGSTIVTAAGLFGALAMGQVLQLDEVMILRSIVYTFTAGMIVLGFLHLSAIAPEFRFSLLPSHPPVRTHEAD